MKVGIVGTGAVGSACLLATVMRCCAREIVLVNRNRRRAEGVATDVHYGATLSPRVDVHAGDYSELAGAALVMLTSGVNEQAGGATNRSDPAGRLRLLQSNADIYQEIVPQIHKAAPDALILVVTDPPDPLADIVRMLGHEHVLSTGTSLDSLRFRLHLARRLKVSPASVDAMVLGEHGTSSVFLWSSARVGGRPVMDAIASGKPRDSLREEIEQEVRYANISIIERIGASQYGIGMVCARIAEIVVRNEQAVLPIGAYQRRYGVTLSLPAVLGANGLSKVYEPDMSNEERRRLERSAEAIRRALEPVRIDRSRAA